MEPPLCACGEPLDTVDMDYGFQLPDALWGMQRDEATQRVKGTETLLVVDGMTAYVRTLLPVQLDHGSVLFGIWIEIEPEAARVASLVWDESAYISLRFEGAIANLLPPWGDSLLGARATASPVNQDELPFISDGDVVVRSLLDDVWSRDELLHALPDLRHAH